MNSNFIKTPNIDGSWKLQKSICSSNIDKSFMKHAIEQYLQKRHFKQIGCPTTYSCHVMPCWSDYKKQWSEMSIGVSYECASSVKSFLFCWKLATKHFTDLSSTSLSFVQVLQLSFVKLFNSFSIWQSNFETLKAWVWLCLYKAFKVRCRKYKVT